MEISLILLEKIVELFLILIMGYILVKARLLKPEDSRIISILLVYLITPFMIINSFLIDVTPQVLLGLAFTTLVSIAIHILLLLFAAISGKLFRLNSIERMTIVYTNAGILVIPPIQAILGQEYVIYSCGFMAVQMVLLWTHCQGTLSGEGGIQWKKVLLNVNIIAIAIGALLLACGIRLPSVLGETIKSVGSMMGPMGMLLAGMIIADIPLREAFSAPRNYLSTALRLLVCPLLLLGLFWLIRPADWIADGKNLLLVVFLACSTPACATLTSIAQLYNNGAKQASVLYVLTTLLSIITMPVMTGIFSAIL